MAIDKESIKELESSLKLEAGTLTKALESEDEVKVELPKLVIRTEDEDSELRENHKTEFGKAAVEIAVKGVRNELELEFTGKTMPNLVEAIKAKTLEDAKIPQEARVKELQTDNDKLRSNIDEWEGKYKGLETDFKQKEKSVRVDGDIAKRVKGEFVISEDKILTIFKSEHAIEFDEDNVMLIKKDGKTLKNDQLSPLGLDDVMPDFLSQFAKKPEGGAGGGDNPGEGKPGSKAAFDKEQVAKGNTIGSSDYNRALQAAITSKELVM